jgi:hypothetical protein
MLLGFLVYELCHWCSCSHRHGTRRALTSVFLATCCLGALLGELDRDLALAVLFQITKYVVKMLLSFELWRRALFNDYLCGPLWRRHFVSIAVYLWRNLAMFVAREASVFWKNLDNVTRLVQALPLVYRRGVISTVLTHIAFSRLILFIHLVLVGNLGRQLCQLQLQIAMFSLQWLDRCG